MKTKIGDTIVTLFCKSCDMTFDDEEERRCPKCWDSDNACYAIARITEFEEFDN